MKNRSVVINGYNVVYSSFYGRYQISHNEIGCNIAEFNNILDVFEYCLKG